MARSGKTRRAAASYILLSGLQRGVGLLILPFVARVMTPAEFGGVTMVASASFLLVSALASPLESQVMYSAPRGGDEGPALLRVAGIYCYRVLPFVAAIPAAVMALFVPVFLSVPGKIWAIEILAMGFTPAMGVFGLAMVRASQDLRRFFVLAGTSLVVFTVAKLTLVVVWRWGMLGWAISDLITAVASYAVAVALVRLPAVRVQRRHVRNVVAFSAPIIPNNVSFWAITSLSRPLLARVSTLAEVGFLSAGLSVATAVTVFVLEVNRAVQPRFSLERFPAPTEQTFNPVRWQIVLALAIPATAGGVFALIGQWIFPPPYWSAFPLTGILLIGQAAYGLYPIAMNYLILTAGLSRLSSIASASGALVILISILAVAGSYGGIGVAFATTAGFCAMVVVAFALTKVAKLDIRWRKWLVCWPQIIPMAIALGLAEVALWSPVGSPTARAFAVACLLIVAAAGMPLALRRKAA
jgi:O-antigen/teichoic acid export membrane protein